MSIAPEPSYKHVANSKLHEILLKIFVVSDVIKYTIVTTDVPDSNNRCSSWFLWFWRWLLLQHKDGVHMVIEEIRIIAI
ncbi:hypothetical protein TVAG_241550 [Trichomonas vaginalis G3]|uniref:Uncharacterized protein n=1 Tax=Trichomonas vaginalis (strain ATCC PRA-98 / G3) TaxID=412133 RepID=A2FL03_TRIV3|nr:axonemal central apparatus assembly [Trichomonas vaginalis G3]EAX94419.1 hypothetical protein TVAG_241550 [Trichomonas vaginalis G3]KAI5499655.1 axonemal central apparatus assembly [Trichomonas vaginalis G3]|eukprot:XP_001307349.1 hypothetical protein [Trichomonas vaginalis G3]